MPTPPSDAYDPKARTNNIKRKMMKVQKPISTSLLRKRAQSSGSNQLPDPTYFDIEENETVLAVEVTKAVSIMLPLSPNEGYASAIKKLANQKMDSVQALYQVVDSFSIWVLNPDASTRLGDYYNTVAFALVRALRIFQKKLGLEKLDFQNEPFRNNRDQYVNIAKMLYDRCRQFVIFKPERAKQLVILLPLVVQLIRKALKSYHFPGNLKSIYNEWSNLVLFYERSMPQHEGADTANPATFGKSGTKFYERVQRTLLLAVLQMCRNFFEHRKLIEKEITQLFASNNAIPNPTALYAVLDNILEIFFYIIYADDGFSASSTKLRIDQAKGCQDGKGSLANFEYFPKEWDGIYTMKDHALDVKIRLPTTFKLLSTLVENADAGMNLLKKQSEKRETAKEMKSRLHEMWNTGSNFKKAGEEAYKEKSTWSEHTWDEFNKWVDTLLLIPEEYSEPCFVNVTHCMNEFQYYWPFAPLIEEELSTTSSEDLFLTRRDEVENSIDKLSSPYFAIEWEDYQTYERFTLNFLDAEQATQDHIGTDGHIQLHRPATIAAILDMFDCMNNLPLDLLPPSKSEEKGKIDSRYNSNQSWRSLLQNGKELHQSLQQWIRVGRASESQHVPRALPTHIRGYINAALQSLNALRKVQTFREKVQLNRKTSTYVGSFFQRLHILQQHLQS